ncbi:hypothetical protein FGADI_10617 [Fusarium gaditjirri]|uniref:Uncharacterized protein n=1 Tax=Fusarium gaditjirri TaxID=282569 RepID=A0A8H4WRB5_9HYPO|nr:hypothetical protein FGADI_10617 [Fusarium gaditjirri]
MKRSGSPYLTHQLVNNVIKSINGVRVEENSNAPKNGPQGRTFIDLVSGTEKANSDKTDMSSSNETSPITQDPNSKAPLANMDNTLPEAQDKSAPKDIGVPEQPQPSPVTRDAEAATSPTSKKRRFDQMDESGIHTYSKYERLISNFKPERVAQLRGEALKDLEQAESSKASFDCALADLKGREDQMKQIRDQSKVLVDEMSNGMRGQGDQGVVAGLLASTGTAYANGLTSLLDLLLQGSSCSRDGRTAEELQAQRAEAVDKAGKAKKRVQVLDHIEKARATHESYMKAKDYRQKIRNLLSETDEHAMELEKACIVAFSHAEQED